MTATNNKIPFRHLLLQYSNTALNIVFPLILFPYMTRTLGPAGYGVIGFYESMMLVVNVWAAFGVNFFGLRLLSKTHIGDTDHLNTVLHLLLINLMLAVTGIIAYLGYVYSKPIPVAGTNITFIYAYIMLIYQLNADWYFQSQEKFRFLVARTFILRLFILVSAILFVRKPEHLIYYILISAANQTFIAASSLSNMKPVFQHWKWNPTLFKKLLIELWPFAMAGVLSSLYFSLDIILLARLGKITDLGHYTVAAKIVRLSLNVFVGASIVFFVRLFRTEVDKQLQAASMLMTIHLSFPIAALLFFFSGPVIRFISGESYLPSVDILRIFSLLWIVVPLHDFFNIQVLLVHHREKLLATIYLGATILSFILNVTLIPIWFTSGAAIAIVITETLVLVAAIVASRPYMKINNALAFEMVLCLAAFPVSMLSYQITTLWPSNAFMQLVFGGILFLLSYAFLQLVIFRNAFLQRIAFQLWKGITRPA